jgi:hypothetical protein
VRNNTSKGETFVSKNNMTRSITILFVLGISVALVSADLIVSAQNSNSSTTQDEPTRGGMMTSQNANTSGTGTQRRRRRPRRRSASSNTNMSTDMSNANMSTTSDTANTSSDMSGNANMDASGNANMSSDMSGGTNSGGRRRGRRRSRAAMTTDTSGVMAAGQMDSADGGAQEDLAGKSYTGTGSYSEGSLSGPATLTFDSGGQFTLTPEGGTAMSGRYSAVTTRGYTGVTMMFTGSTPAQIVSVRLKKMGNGVSIMSVPGESRQFSFTSSGGGAMASSGGRRRPRRRKRSRIKPPMATPADTTQSPTQ